MKKSIPIAISNRHIHLSEHDLFALFGEGYTLTKWKDLSQPGQFAANEKLTIIGPKNAYQNVRILGPVRVDTQVEISITDAFYLGIAAPIRHSGDIKDTPGCRLIGPAGEVEINKGVIVAARHIHMHTDDAMLFEVKDKDIVEVEVSGERAITYKNVLVRVSDAFALEMHVDIDEGNSGNIANVKQGVIVK